MKKQDVPLFFKFMYKNLIEQRRKQTKGPRTLDHN